MRDSDLRSDNFLQYPLLSFHIPIRLLVFLLSILLQDYLPFGGHFEDSKRHMSQIANPWDGYSDWPPFSPCGPVEHYSSTPFRYTRCCLSNLINPTAKGPFQLLLNVEWKLPTFLKEEFGEGVLFQRLLTLTANTRKVAIAGSCEDYLNRNWPSTSQLVLDAVPESLCCSECHEESSE